MVALLRCGAAAVLLVVLALASAARPAPAGAVSADCDGVYRNSTVSYAGHQVWRCLLDSHDHLLEFRSLSEDMRFDVWKLLLNETHVRGKKEDLLRLKERFACEVLIEDLQELLDHEEEQSRHHVALKRDNPSWFDTYHSFDEIVEYLEDLATAYPDLVTYIPSIGKSVEGRDIPVIRIKATTNPTKTVFFSGGVHAREWVAISTVLYVATRILEGRFDKDVVTLLNSLEFVIAPCVNPDGYVYSYERDRMWRKNRQVPPSGTPYCYGVDLNRNFDNHWGGIGASSFPCAEDYHGLSAASEPETQAVQNFVMTLPNRSGAIDFHAYGQLILRSFGYTHISSPNEEILERVGSTISSVIQGVSGRKYSSWRAADLYPTTGSTDDWYTETGGMWGWTIELRDTGVYGFRLPASQIIPTGQEIWEAMKYFSQVLADKGPSSN